MPKSKKPIIDFNLRLNETMRQTFGEPIIDTDRTLEETFNKLFEELSAYREHLKERYQNSRSSTT